MRRNWAAVSFSPGAGEFSPARLRAARSTLRKTSPPTTTSTSTSDAVASLVGHPLRVVGDQLILKTLEQCGGNRTKAAEILEIGVRTLFNRLKGLQVRI